MRASVRDRLAEDVGLWVTDGLIAPETARVLRERWDQPGLGLLQIIKYVGFAGGLLAFFGLLGLVSVIAQSEMLGAVLLAACGCAGLYFGIRLSLDARGRYAVTGNVVLALGMTTFALGVGVLLHAFGAAESTIVLVGGCLTLPVAFVLAYHFRNLFLLVLGLLATFHWVGSWTRMFGRSTYALSIQDPRWMCAASLLAIGVGLAHDHAAPGPRLYLAYQAVGLTYLNLSLLILTIANSSYGGAHDANLIWIGVWALCGVAQLVAGARLHSSLFTAFGVVALAVNLYTRYYEAFWNSLDAGLFILCGGALMFGAGFALERRARVRLRPEPAT